MLTLLLSAPGIASAAAPVDAIAHPKLIIAWMAVGLVGLIVGAVAVHVSKRNLLLTAVTGPIVVAPERAVTLELAAEPATIAA